MEVKLKTLFNSSDKDILNYRIEEGQVDPETGQVYWDEDRQSYKKTGNTYEWSIKAGETLTFPYYVADYLQHIYEFLKTVKDKQSQGIAKSNKESLMDPASLQEDDGEDNDRE